MENSKNCLFFLCGPPAFMRLAQFTLKTMGFEENQIKKENFTVEYLPGPPLVRDPSPKQIIIHFDKQKFQIESVSQVNILQAALNHKIPLPYSCRGGRCSACMAKCLSGKVKMSINEVLTDKDLSDGYVLTCVGYPETDVELAF